MITCEECKGACCKEISVEIDTPLDLEDWDVIKWMVAHENVAVYQDHEDDWLVEFKTKCSKLDFNNRCTIYKVRPKVCSEYPVDDCIMNADEPAEKIRFETMEEVEKYIEDVVKIELLKKEEEKRLVNTEVCEV
ncbi:MAG: hypothetical protein QT08_C0015G0022 [archaeon GW2011_AR17]|nr:MAG: hypothetical protein QT08_C0015G0022 [archaeon GW2011_AR17]MBS3154023.1 YkgJ family cysteine cluster protein [Candidatus Woesearchaeota archaeon]HIJ05426.1 hypothetical protein [Nanoarchaeota archaeon]